MSEAKRKSKYDRLLVTRLVTFLVDDHLISKWMISLQIKQIIMKHWKFFTCEINPLTNIFVIIPSESWYLQNSEYVPTSFWESVRSDAIRDRKPLVGFLTTITTLLSSARDKSWGCFAHSLRVKQPPRTDLDTRVYSKYIKTCEHEVSKVPPYPLFFALKAVFVAKGIFYFLQPYLWRFVRLRVLQKRNL